MPAPLAVKKSERNTPASIIARRMAKQTREAHKFMNYVPPEMRGERRDGQRESALTVNTSAANAGSTRGRRDSNHSTRAETIDVALDMDIEWGDLGLDRKSLGVMSIGCPTGRASSDIISLRPLDETATNIVEMYEADYPVWHSSPSTPLPQSGGMAGARRGDRSEATYLELLRLWHSTHSGQPVAVTRTAPPPSQPLPPLPHDAKQLIHAARAAEDKRVKRRNVLKRMLGINTTPDVSEATSASWNLEKPRLNAKPRTLFRSM